MPGTLSGNIAIAELGSSGGKEVVCTTDGAAVLVEFDHEGYVVCHWPLSYGVFDADGVDEALTVELPLVESVKIGAYDGINQVEGIGPAVVRAAEVEGAVVLEAALSRIVEGDEGTALLEEASATEEVDEFELDSVVTDSGTSMVTVGELTSMIEYPVLVTVAGLGVTVTSTV